MGKWPWIPTLAACSGAPSTPTAQPPAPAPTELPTPSSISLTAIEGLLDEIELAGGSLVRSACRGVSWGVPGGDTLHNHGTHAVLREITPEGRAAWGVRWGDEEGGCSGFGSGHAVGRSAPIEVDLYAFVPERA
ncbi:MAG TPA: hypothetical protein ENK18_22280 [Deltaproteobacteria bacterium]|nr:hypothetical protein [Deltaproteobacteria bacterium]